MRSTCGSPVLPGGGHYRAALLRYWKATSEPSSSVWLITLLATVHAVVADLLDHLADRVGDAGQQMRRCGCRTIAIAGAAIQHILDADQVVVGVVAVLDLAQPIS